MFLVPQGLQIIVVDPPYDSLTNPLVQRLMGKVQALKLDGYKICYPYGVLPVDTYDMIATHHLVCREKDGELEPLMGYRSVTLERCITHRLPFPALSLITASGERKHEQALRKILDRAEKAHGKISYGSSWTMATDLRDEPETRAFLKKIMGGMLVCDEQDTQTPERIGAGVVRFKTDRFFQDLGYRPLEEKKTPLPIMKHTSLFGEPVLMMHCQEFSEHGLRCADEVRPFWEARLVLGAEKSPAATQTKKKAAA